MTREPEVLALMAIIDRLAERFPHEQRSVIEEVVAEEHELLDDGPIRDYVPVLVERAAKLRLAHHHSSRRPEPGKTEQVAVARGIGAP